MEEAVKLEKAAIEEDKSRKQLYEKSIRELSLKESNAIKREKEAKYLIDFQNRVLDEKAKKITYVLTVGGVLYSFYVTTLAVMTSVRFKSNFKAFVEGICSVMAWIWENLLLGANTVSNIFNNIPNEIVATVISWLMHWIIVLLVLAIILGGVGWCVYTICQFYKDNFADRLSTAVMLINFSLLVLLGDYIGKIIKSNLLLFFVIIQVVYIMIRMYLKKTKF